MKLAMMAARSRGRYPCKRVLCRCVRVVRLAQMKADGCSFQMKSRPQGILQIAQIGLRQRLQLIAKDRKCRRPALGLGHVADSNSAPMDRRWRMPGERILQETVQHRRRDARVPRPV